MKRCCRFLSLLLTLTMLLGCGAFAMNEAEAEAAASAEAFLQFASSEDPFDASAYTSHMLTSPDNDFRTDLQYEHRMSK